MKKYIAYIVACLVLIGMLASCTAEELEPQNPIDNAKSSCIGIEPIGPTLPKP